MSQRNSGFFVLIPFLITICIYISPAGAKYSGGTGHANAPYQIATAQDLIDLSRSSFDHYSHFILTADIDMNPNLPNRRVFDGAVIPYFYGVFNGNGHVIKNVHIRDDSYAGWGNSYVGFFRIVEEEAVVANLGLEAVDVEGTSDYVGGLAGVNNGVITLSHCNGSVTGDSSVGGLVGYCGFWSNITLSYSTGTVSGVNRVGGLVGFNDWGPIISCYSTCSVSGDSEIGGLVGRCWDSIVSSYSAGQVSGKTKVGGLVGDGKYGKVVSSFWDIDTSEQNRSRGGTGLSTVEMHNIYTYLNEGWDFIEETTNGNSNFWQIQNESYPLITVFSDISLSFNKGTGIFDDPYLLNDANDLGAVWCYPLAHYRLEADIDLSGIIWNTAVVPFLGGRFEGDGYVIRNLHIEGAEYLGLFGRVGSRASILNLSLEAADVNGTEDNIGGLAGDNWGIISYCHSSGIVSGDMDTGGLVGNNDEHGIIEMSYSNCMVTGGDYLGGLVGNNWGSIMSSYCKGVVTGNWEVGGLVGANWSLIMSSYNTGSTSGNNRIGGLVGYNSLGGRIISSYSTGSVSQVGTVGGLVGLSNQGSVTTSFWDIETSGQNESDGGIGKTTAEMKDIQTFLEVGWDFRDETVNGDEDTWDMIDEPNYPSLSWENISSSSDDASTDSTLVGYWSVTLTGLVGGWPIHLEGTDISVIFEFLEDTFVVTITESSVLLSETIGTYHNSDGLLYLTPTETQGSETNSDFLVPAISEYSINNDILTLTEIADDPVWYELERIN